MASSLYTLFLLTGILGGGGSACLFRGGLSLSYWDLSSPGENYSFILFTSKLLHQAILQAVPVADPSLLRVNYAATGFLCNALALSVSCQVPKDQIPDLQAPSNTK